MHESKIHSLVPTPPSGWPASSFLETPRKRASAERAKISGVLQVCLRASLQALFGLLALVLAPVRALSDWLHGQNAPENGYWQHTLSLQQFTSVRDYELKRRNLLNYENFYLKLLGNKVGAAQSALAESYFGKTQAENEEGSESMSLVAEDLPEVEGILLQIDPLLSIAEARDRIKSFKVAADAVKACTAYGQAAPVFTDVRKNLEKELKAVKLRQRVGSAPLVCLSTKNSNAPLQAQR